MNNFNIDLNVNLSEATSWTAKDVSIEDSMVTYFLHGDRYQATALKWKGPFLIVIDKEQNLIAMLAGNTDSNSAQKDELLNGDSIDAIECWTLDFNEVTCVHCGVANHYGEELNDEKLCEDCADLNPCDGCGELTDDLEAEGEQFLCPDCLSDREEDELEEAPTIPMERAKELYAIIDNDDLAATTEFIQWNRSPRMRGTPVLAAIKCFRGLLGFQVDEPAKV